MSIKRAAGIAVGLVAAAFLFAWVYIQFGSEYQAKSGTSMLPTMATVPALTQQPVTADTTVNSIVDGALAEDSEVDGAATDDEMQEVDAEAANVSDLAGVYDTRDVQ